MTDRVVVVVADGAGSKELKSSVVQAFGGVGETLVGDQNESVVPANGCCIRIGVVFYEILALY